MYENVIYNRHMFYRDKFYDYKKFCERISLAKSNCHPPPPPEYPFLRDRQKKHEMENERKKEIKFNEKLLIQKYKSMYRNHNKYHPSNLKFQPHPPSLKLSEGTAQYYELCKNNNYLGKKIKEVQNSKGYYNCGKSLEHYKKLKYLKDEMVKSSKYNNNILLDLVTPFTYEKRLNKLFGKTQGNKSARRRPWSKQNIFYRTSTGFNTNNYNLNNANNMNYNENSKISNNLSQRRKIEIERENISNQ
jgi:hypothetical protein